MLLSQASSHYDLFIDIVIQSYFQFGGSEAIITGITDEFPILKKKREIFVAVLFVVYFLVGLASCTYVSIICL